MTPLQTLAEEYRAKINEYCRKATDPDVEAIDRAYLMGVSTGLQLALNEIPAVERHSILMAEMDREFMAHIGEGL